MQNSQLTYATAEFVAKVTYRFMIRYTKSVTLNPAMRIQYLDPIGITHTYEIETLVNEKQANNSILILAYELEGGA